METKVFANDVLFPEIVKMISEGLSVDIKVKGNSMNPFFVSGRDVIRLSPVKKEDLRVGQFVFGKESHGHWVAHRVVEVGMTQIVLNGDGNFAGSCEYMKFEDVVAVIKEYVRDGKPGNMDGFAWRAYSAYWKVAGKVRVGKWSVRRIHLGIWRRLHPSLVLKITK